MLIEDLQKHAELYFVLFNFSLGETLVVQRYNKVETRMVHFHSFPFYGHLEIKILKLEAF